MKVTYLNNDEMLIGSFDRPITRELIKKIEITQADLAFMLNEPQRFDEFKINIERWINKIGVPVIV